MTKYTNKITLYQVFPRLFGNKEKNPIPDGSIEQNGVGKFSDFTPEALKKINQLGITHIWYTGIIEHATQTNYTSFGISHDHHAIVKGKAGSPYAIKDYYDADPDLADDVPNRMLELEALIDRTHDAGMKMIIDFVPNHVSRQYHSDTKPPMVDDLGAHDHTSVAFSPDNNFYYLPGQPLVLHFGAQQEDFEYSEFPAKVTGNGCFTATPGKDDWYETIKLNYGIDYVNGGNCYFDPIPDTWHKMLDILLFWAEKGIDGFRCDMVELVPVAFWNWAIPKVKEKHADLIFIAEAYIPDNYRDYIYNGHFDYLYDKVGLYDTLRNIIGGRASALAITHCRQATGGIRQHMLYFLENHDEQRIASEFFANSAQAGFPGMIVAALMHTGPILIYSGQELGEPGMEEEGFSGRDGRTSIFDYGRIDTIQRWINDGKLDDTLLSDQEKTLRHSYMQLLNIARQEPAIANGTFFDLMYANHDNPHINGNRQYFFLRKYKQDVILVAVNFDNSAQTVRIRIPSDTFEALTIPDNKPAMLSDLLTGDQTISTLTAAAPYQVTLPPYSGKIVKFSYDFSL